MTTNDPTLGLLDYNHLAALVILSALIVAAVYMELRERRIPNYLTYPGVVTGLILSYLPGGISLMSCAVGFLIGFGTLFAFYLFGGMGGGDVKLMGAVGALLGFPMIIPAVVYTAVAGGLMAIVMLIWRLDFGRMLAWLSPKTAPPAGATAPTPPAVQPDAAKASIPYGIAIGIGCLLTIYLR